MSSVNGVAVADRLAAVRELLRQRLQLRHDLFSRRMIGVAGASARCRGEIFTLPR